jgi:hypothetical protein
VVWSTLPLGTQKKLARLDDAARLIPVSSKTVGILGHRKTIPYGEGQMGLSNDLLGLLQRVSRERHNRHVERVKGIKMSLIGS